ncbi:MAG: ornithine cyclodeaminase [Gemmatimonadota bacterium]|nr:ornithine cyclodeaminase [Gemmatimonadota bacterium]
MRVLSGDDVRTALPLATAVARMKEAFASLARGDAAVPPRTQLAAADGAGVTLVMPARVDGKGRALAVKVVSVFGRNPGAGLARIQGAVIVLEPETGRPVALLEGSMLTAIRTAAASGAATDLLAPARSEVLAVLGAGVQARAHIEAMCAVRPISRVRVFAPTTARVAALIGELAGRTAGGPEMSRAATAADAVRGADIVCAATTSATPVFDDADLEPGAHVNAVGSFTPGAREVSGATVARAWVVVDERAAAWTEAGDLIRARDEGLIGADHVRAELGELVLDPGLRPADPGQPTLFKSVGVAVQDAVAAAAALEEAERRGLGAVVDW